MSRRTRRLPRPIAFNSRSRSIAPNRNDPLAFLDRWHARSVRDLRTLERVVRMKRRRPLGVVSVNEVIPEFARHMTRSFAEGEASIVDVSVNGVGSSFPENHPKVEFVEPDLGPVDLAGWAIDRIEFACDDISVEHPNNNTVFSLTGRILIYGHRL